MLQKIENHYFIKLKKGVGLIKMNTIIKEKKLLTIVIIISILILSGCSKKMTEGEYKSFEKILNGKIEMLMELSVNKTKEPFILEEREKLHTSAISLRNDIYETIDENKNKIPKNYKKEFSEDKLKQYVDKLVDYVMLENKGIQEDKMKTVEDIIELTNCKFKKKPTSEKEWFDTQKKEMKKEIYNELVDANEIDYNFSVEEFKKGSNIIISGYANIDEVAAPFFTDSYNNVLVNISETTDSNNLDRTIGWFFLINKDRNKELYEELIYTKNLPIIAWIIPYQEINPNAYIDSVGIPMKFIFSNEWNE